MTSVPPGWTRTTLGELGEYLNGRAFKKSEWAETGRPIIRIQNLTGSGAAFNYFQGDLEDRYVARPGDLLVSWAATLGAYIWTGPEAVVNQHIFKVRSRIDRKFHKYLLDHKLAELMTHTHGSGMVHITRSKFDSVSVDVPSLSEQQRIVEVLEDHLSRLEAADRLMHTAGLRLDTLLMSALTRSVSEMRQRGVPFTPLGDLADTTLGKMLDARKVSGEPTPYLANINVRWGRFDLENLREVSLTPRERERLKLLRGDILVCEGGEPGRCAVWEVGSSDIAFQKALHRIRVLDPEALSPHFVALMLREAIQSRRWDSLFTGTTIRHLPQEKLRRIEIAVPPIVEQRQLQAHAQEVERQAARQREAFDASKRRSQALRRGLLAAAFSGSLMGHSRDDEVIVEFVH